MNEPDEKMDVYSGVRWNAVATFGCQTVRFVTSITLARLLAPEYFGLLAMAEVFVGFAGTFSTMGFSKAIVQRKRISEELLCSLFFVTLAIGCLVALILACASPLFAWIYGNPEVDPIISALSLTFILGAPCLVPAALLTRRLAFNRLAIIDLSCTALSAAAAITLARLGWGVWALVWPTVTVLLIRVPMMYVASGWRPKLLFQWSEVRNVLGFGGNLTGFTIVNYFSRQSDKFIVGFFLGPSPLAYYSLAYNIMLRPLSAVTDVLGRVMFPAFSRMQDDDAWLKAAYLRACGAIAFVTFPLMLGMTALARPFVGIVLGEKWLPAIPILVVLAPLGALQSIQETVGQIFLAKGRADWYFRLGVGGGVLFMLSFLAGIPWGILGITVAYSIVYVPWSVFSFWLAFRLIHGLSLFDLARSLFPYLWKSVLMGILVAFLNQRLVPLNLPHGISLIICIATGVVIYVVLTLVFRPPAFYELKRLVPGPVRNLVKMRNTGSKSTSCCETRKNTGKTDQNSSQLHA
jgi:O-antigen/teichoic acid export membrane protein